MTNSVILTEGSYKTPLKQGEKIKRPKPKPFGIKRSSKAVKNR